MRLRVGLNLLLLLLLQLLLPEQSGVLVGTCSSSNAVGDTRLVGAASRSVHGGLSLGHHGTRQMLGREVASLFLRESGVLRSELRFELGQLVLKALRELVGHARSGRTAGDGRHVQSVRWRSAMAIGVVVVRRQHGLSVVEEIVLVEAGARVGNPIAVDSIGSIDPISAVGATVDDPVAHGWRAMLTL